LLKNKCTMSCTKLIGGGEGARGGSKNRILGQITLCYFVLRLTKDYFWAERCS